MASSPGARAGLRSDVAPRRGSRRSRRDKRVPPVVASAPALSSERRHEARGVRRQDETDPDDHQRQADLHPGDPPAREPGEQHSSHSHRDQADDHEDDANPRLKTRTVKSPRSSLPLATAASRMASAPGSGSNPPATPSPSRMPSTRPGARHRLEVVRVVSTPRVAVQRRTPVGFTPGDRQEAPLASQHPETDADDQASGPDGEIRLDSLRSARWSRGSPGRRPARSRSCATA